MRASLLSAALAVALLSAHALAPAVAADASAADASENGRYSMTPAPDGFLRLDTRTGAVSLCKVDNGQARCQAAIEERAALENEIGRIARQNEDLKKKQDGLGLPSRGDFDRAMDYVEQFMRRMMRVLRDEAPPKNQT